MPADDSIDWSALRATAIEAAACAHAPYSHLHVGAAGLTNNNTTVSGCNVENASYGLTLCAECGLVSALHRSGADRLVAVSIVDGHGQFLWPCGRCRQLLHEAGGPNLLVDATDGPVPLEQLLPYAFGAEHLPAWPNDAAQP